MIEDDIFEFVNDYTLYKTNEIQFHKILQRVRKRTCNYEYDESELRKITHEEMIEVLEEDF